MPGGRPPKPTRLKILQGNPGRRPLPENEPQPPPGDGLKCPPWLSKYAKAKWRELAPKLLALGLLTEVDGETFAVACQAWHEFRTATETLDREGRTVRTGGQVVDGEQVGGQLQPHPAVSQQRSAWEAWRKASALFGLDPSGRVRVKAPGNAEKERDPFEDLLGGKGVDN